MMESLNIKKDFPALQDNALVYFDNAATTQMPNGVLEAVAEYQSVGRGNPYRGLHSFAERATKSLQESRSTIASFIGAKPEELLFTKSTTEGLNIVAKSVGSELGPGDEVVLSILEHHANVLPWRELAEEQGFSLVYLPMTEDGTISLEQAKKAIGPRTKVVAITYASNVLGSLLPVREVSELAHEVGALCVIDAAQTVAHVPVNVVDLDCDFLAFGAHKMYGPDGIGALYVANRVRARLKPLLYGGGMVDEVLDHFVRYAEDIRLFEAGTPNVTGAIGFAAACTYLSSQDSERIQAHEAGLTRRLLDGLSRMPEVKVHARDPRFGRIGVISFSLQGVHSHDVAQLLADKGFAVRAGYHCAAPLTRCLDVSGTVRVSFGIYNTEKEVDDFLEALHVIQKRFTL